MTKREPKTDPPSAPSPLVALKGSPILLRAAWIMLAAWILALSALALHVVGIW